MNYLKRESNVWDCYTIVSYLMKKCDFEGIELCYNEDVSRPKFVYKGYTFVIEYNKDTFLRLSLIDETNFQKSEFNKHFDDLEKKYVLYNLGYFLNKRLGCPTIYYEITNKDNGCHIQTLEWGIQEREELIKSAVNGDLLGDEFDITNLEIFGQEETVQNNQNINLKMSKQTL